MRDARIGVAAISMEKRYVIFNNGLQLPIVEFLDANRKSITDPNIEPRFYHFGDEENGFGIGNLDAYEMPSYEDH